MGENSKIEWTDHTFNPWVGCSKVHEGCQFCYAEINQFVRFKNIKWGDQGKRVVTSEANWKHPKQWNADAAAAGVRKRVFCASLSDVFEDRPELVEPRQRLFELIDATPNLDWLLLTKRPENIPAMWPDREVTKAGDEWKSFRRARPNVWLGTSVSLQPHAEKQIPPLLAVKDLAAGTFLSIEPMLGPVDLMAQADWFWSSNLKWIIAGGESGPKARPCHPDWIRKLRDQCGAAGVPFFFKQWGEIIPKCQVLPGMIANEEDFTAFDVSDVKFFRVGKKRAGAKLDGRLHRETPFAYVDAPF